jgi:type II secretory pathway pseudopilin PulG
VKRTRTCHQSAFSLTEILVATTIFSFVVLFSAIYLDRSQQLWRKVNANQDAGLALRKASLDLQQNLVDASGKEFGVVDNGSGGARMGQAFWFLSAIDPVTGQFVTGANGRPFWQKNILYFLTVPDDHNSRYGLTCQQFGRVCPHKILVSKTIDIGNPTTPTSAEADEETLMTVGQAQTYLVRPPTLDVTDQESLPEVVEARYVCGSLLDMTVTLDEQGSKVEEVDILLESGLVEAARNKLVVGKDPFTSPTFVLSKTVGVIPRNF